MTAKKKKIKFLILLISFSTILISGCSSINKLIPVPMPDQEISLKDPETINLTKDGYSLSLKASYKNRFVIFHIEINNQSDKDIEIKKDDINILDGKNNIQNILDEDQVMNVYNDQFYIGFYPYPFPYDDPFFFDDFYYHHRFYTDHIYHYSIDRELFIRELYKNIFKYGRIPKETTRVGNIFIQNLDVELPIKFLFSINGCEFKFQFDNIKTHK
jgi:hypothetical protein